MEMLAFSYSSSELPQSPLTEASEEENTIRPSAYVFFPNELTKVLLTEASEEENTIRLRNRRMLTFLSLMTIDTLYFAFFAFGMNRSNGLL